LYSRYSEQYDSNLSKDLFQRELKMRIHKTAFSYALIPFLLAGSTFAQNPIIQTIYTADPAPMVYNDTVYLYADHDEDGSTYYTMNDWRCYSSTDMVNWTDHGVMMSYKTFSWAKGDAWAGQCVYGNGKFYYYVPITSTALGRPAIGVGVSNSPTGPFTDALGHPLIADEWGDIDPTAFIDDDGQAYLYWGNPNLYYVKLNNDMISYDKTVGIVQVPLTTEGFGKRTGDPNRATLYEEGPWFYKRNGLYYLLFSAGGIPEYISYSTSTSPTGPWTYKGVIMPTQGGSFTNHCGVIDYEGNSYFFYHNGALPGGGGFTRSICIEQFTYNADGSFPTINMTTAGVVNAVSNLNPYKRNEAETMAWESGIETEKCSQGGVSVYAIENGDYIRIRSVDFGDRGPGAFAASISSATIGGTIELRLNSKTGTLIGTLPVNYTSGWDNWRTETINISGAAGVNDLYLVFNGTANTSLFKMDYWNFEQKSETHDLLAINATVDNYKIDTISGSNTATLIVLAIYTDGTSEDITSAAEVIPQQDGIVDISNGIIKGITYNPVAVNVSYQGKTDIVNMLIKDLKSEVTARTLSLDKYTMDLLSGSTANIIVTVEYYDGHTEDVTTKASYINPNGSVASISAGKITAKSKGTTIITVSFKGLLGDTVTAQLTINVSNRDPYNRNEAEEYSAQNGIQTENCSDTGGGINVGYIENGDWLRFNSLDFGSGAALFEARVASATNGGNLEIRLDNLAGTLAGTCVVTGTGGWQTWVTKSCSVSGLSSIHDIYLKFTGGSGYLFNINWWKFKPEQTEVVLEQHSSSNEIPYSFFLGQNYPNPFNPSTTIQFSVSRSTFVTLKVFNLLGQEIATLAAQEFRAGSYSLNWNAIGVPSGVYFYRLVAGSFLETKKMFLLR
jgi:arabinoxylan arabinofuranohydrolase